MRSVPAPLWSGLAACVLLALPSLLPAQVAAATTQAPAEARGPLKDRIGLYSPENNWLVLGGARHPVQRARTFHLGTGNRAFAPDIAVAGDWDGDGWDTIGLYDQVAGDFHLARRNLPGEPDWLVQTGTPGFWPIAGDFDGDGYDTLGIYASPTGEFWLWDDLAGGSPDVAFAFGPSDSWPVVGDFDGDGIDTVGVYELAAGRFHLKNSHSGGGADLAFFFGPPGAYAVAGDWDGDGVDTIGTFDPLSAEFWLRNSNDAGPPDRRLPFEGSDLIVLPLAGQWSVRGRAAPYTGYRWPASSPEAQGMDSAALQAAAATAAVDPDYHSLLVARHGQLVHESYFNGWNGEVGNCVKSVSKSLLSALYGLAWAQGHIPDMAATVKSYLPEYFAGNTDPRKDGIRIEHLLTMTSGLQWDESAIVPDWIAAPDWGAFVIEQPAVADPGTVFEYSTGLTHVGSALLARATGAPTRDFAQQFLFEPLGIEVTRWDYDPQGIDFGGSELWMRPRDMLRFGQVYLDDGVAGGVPVIDPLWIQSSTVPIVHPGGASYGAWWWQDEFAGEDAYFAWGYGGQFIFVFPALDMVVVVTSSWNVSAAQTADQYDDVFTLLAQQVVPAVTGP